MAQKQFDVRSVIVRILDPARAEFYRTRGLNVVCPTQSAIETLTNAVRAFEGALAYSPNRQAPAGARCIS